MSSSPLFIVGIIACDMRQVYMAKKLCHKGFHIILYPSSRLTSENVHKILDTTSNDLISFTDDISRLIHKSSVIAGPVPFDLINTITDEDEFISKICRKSINSDLVLYAGKIPEAHKTLLTDYGITVIDFMEDEELAIFNSIATAEGVISNAICLKDSNIHNSKCLVLGYGKCAKTLAYKLKGLSADVTIAARNPKDLAAALSLGYSTLNFSSLKKHIHLYEYIFNTIPALILTKDIISHIKKDSLILDIASMPGGADQNACKKYNIEYRHCLSLPGKYAPKSSGYAICDHFLRVLSPFIKQRI